MKIFSVQINTTIYDTESRREAKPCGMTVTFETYEQMWSFIKSILDLAKISQERL